MHCLSPVSYTHLCLDEQLYRQTLWNHRPLQDFWRIGPGIARKLEHVGIFTMKDLAEADEDMLYHMFGVDAEPVSYTHLYGRHVKCCKRFSFIRHDK